MNDSERLHRFEQTILPHTAAAYNFARWLTRRDQDAEDVVQEAFVRAFKYFAGYQGGDARAWLLTIVRNTCYTWLRQNRAHEFSAASETELEVLPEVEAGPEGLAQQSANKELVHQALEDMPLEYREILVLRELEGLSYKEIGEATGIPMGTVMSRLARARNRLQQAVLHRRSGEIKREL